jgi:DNA-directed RNA polymerase subunit M/transcription elongation factor TFIIS
MAANGDVCPKCRRGVFVIASSQRSGEYQTRYLRCTKCGATAKQLLPSHEVPVRQRRKVVY